MIKGAQSSLVPRLFQCCTPGFQRATFKGREWPRNEAILREGGNVITLDLQMTLIRVTKFSSLELFLHGEPLHEKRTLFTYEELKSGFNCLCK